MRGVNGDVLIAQDCPGVRVGFARVLIFALAAATLCFGQCDEAAKAPPTSVQEGRTGYRLVKEFRVEGEGYWDYIALDSQMRRLYVPHGPRVEVLDADSGLLVGQIKNAPGVHGVALASTLNRGFTSNGGDKSVSIFDTKTLQTIQKIQLPSAPDFILFDPFTSRVFPMDERVTVLDARTGDVAGVLDLGGDPEAAVSDGSGRVWINLKDKDSVVMIDPLRLKIIATYPIQQCTGPHSLSYDPENQRLFIGCQNGFAAIDALTGKLVGWTVQCSGVDASGYDPERKLVLESCAEGVISIIRQVSPDFYGLAETIPTRLWAKTMVLDPKTRNIYLPTADFETISINDPKSPLHFQQRMVPGTFRVLVVSVNQSTQVIQVPLEWTRNFFSLHKLFDELLT